MRAPLPLMEVAANVLDTIAASPRLFCLLDFDGTLAPLASTPGGAMPLAGTAGLLRSLAALPGTSVAIVSGRPIEDVSARLGVAEVYYIGVHGLETRPPHGETTRIEGVEAIRGVMPAIRADLERELGPRPGILVEDKVFAVACHYRLASRADAAAARWTTAAAARRYRARGARIGLTEGHEVVEIRPDFADKGRAVRALLGPGAAPTLPLYAGDDRTDEDAFAALPPHSITIHVGEPSPRSRARYRAADPLELHAFLASVVRCRSR